MNGILRLFGIGGCPNCLCATGSESSETTARYAAERFDRRMDYLSYGSE